MATDRGDCGTRLLTDLPADKDAFGAHERVARAIADVVRTEDGGRTIGLEGGWGAGKSTVVKLLEQELAGDADSAAWIFDAWAHEGDPLRRSFLEGLSQALGVSFVGGRREMGRKAGRTRQPSPRRRDENVAEPHKTWQDPQPVRPMRALRNRARRRQRRTRRFSHGRALLWCSTPPDCGGLGSLPTRLDPGARVVGDSRECRKRSGRVRVGRPRSELRYEAPDNNRADA